MKQETICALSTPQGMGALALIRLSGPESTSIVQRVFSKNLSVVLTHTVVHGWITEDERKVDDVVVTLFRSPKSFTGEDTVEIACHGSLFIQQKILHLLLLNGARMANPGEFTMRAFMHGKMDLSQAEAIGDLIASESEAAHRQALHQMRGGFSKDINTLRDKLIHFASMLELELDFAEEDVEFANRGELSSLLNEIRLVVSKLENSFALGNAIKNGIPVAIVGAPNMGKSTLLNAFLNEERAIVSDIPGTTRDTVEDHLTLGGMRFRFIDTAGLRETVDEIETLGIERAYARAIEASVVLFVFDISTTSPDELLIQVEDLRNKIGMDANIILVANKSDKLIGDIPKELEAFKNLVCISAKSNIGMEELKHLLLIESRPELLNSGETIVMNARHHRALGQAREALDCALQGIENGLTNDLLMVDIRQALHHLGSITGQIGSDDLLNHIFSTFCIGK
ncbi:MAG: tRNA uridine-5-carboxymethylaminomethyl(34) synthesis GTPase MnmE [Flavobacteriales bacterium]|nr:tRNA uridine-5-carboxymethylaminomethyl(34) synthesis GTPase MnmE [Flavobacteriales bacterium]